MIKTLTPFDVPFVTTLESEHKLASWVDSYNTKTWILSNELKPIGFITWFESEDSAEILNIAISTQFISCGYGSKLLKTWLKLLNSMGIKHFFLDVHASDTKAINFYKKHGFMINRIRKGYYQSIQEDALEMRLTMTKIIICAIETSCDETSVALVQNGKTLLSQVTYSQIQSHQVYKGVMPELASRLHIQVISLVIKDTLTKANLTWDEVDAIAFTIGPGLVGSLHVGALAAKTISWALNKPLIGVNHLAGHIHANAFVNEIKYPCLALVVSGGHTELIMMQGPLNFDIIAQTQDDAIGEAYDKVGRLLGLNYPAGPQIDQLAKNGKATYPMPQLKIEKTTFSYSGIKSHFNNLVHNMKQRNVAIIIEDMCATFQITAVNQVIERLNYAIEQHNPKQVIIAGGVSANSYLRLQASNLMKTYPTIDFSIPPVVYCTDNAAMIGAAAYHYYIEKRFVSLNAKVNPGLTLI